MGMMDFQPASPALVKIRHAATTWSSHHTNPTIEYVASMLRKNTIILLSIDIHDSSTFYIGNGNRPFLRGL